MPSIADLLVEQGRVLADARLRRGERAGAMVTGLGEIPARIIADRESERQRKLAETRQAAADQRAADENARQQAEEARAQTTFTDARGLEQKQREQIQGWIKQHAATLKPEEAAQMESVLAMPGGPAHLAEHLSKIPEPYTLREGEQRRGADNQLLAENEPKPLKGPDAGTFPDFVSRYATEHGKQVRDLTAKDIEDARQRYAISDNATAADVTQLTPAGLDIAALNYKKTGVMPALGMGDKTTRQKIINRAATITPEDETRIIAGGTDIATNKASYKADAASLAKLQPQRDAISSFEKTAGKNIDIFLDQAKHVIDTGSPLLNRPLRSLTGKILGSPDQAAYDAARQVAINEVAKITSNPNLTGVLSDSARKEIEAFNPNSATLKQTIAVFKLLKRDMANRAGSMDGTIAEIKDRMKAPTKAPAGKIRARDPKGVLHEADAGTKLPDGWTLEQ